MVGVCCGCIAQPASVQPRKTYNTLVAQLFGGEPIKTSDPLDSSLRRKIQKLQEYIQKNPAKIPKVCSTSLFLQQVLAKPRQMRVCSGMSGRRGCCGVTFAPGAAGAQVQAEMHSQNA